MIDGDTFAPSTILEPLVAPSNYFLNEPNLSSKD